jgi:pSer/pThr/pTyr-binding forkhead associated (FHA) protein
MTYVTLRVIDGADRGKVYEDVNPPVTIGREEGNTIQLNDERVSRFHAKIQDDHDYVVLTDLESTNGTKVNGEETQVRILRHGDLIAMGRSVLLFGTRQQINDRMMRLKNDDNGRSSRSPQKGDMASRGAKADKLDRPGNKDDKLSSGELLDPANWQNPLDVHLRLLELEPPKLPERLSPGQLAQLADLLEYLHLMMRRLIQSVEITPRSQDVHFTAEQWQNLLDLQARLAEYLRQIGHPNG